jgi:hypothetical protein
VHGTACFDVLRRAAPVADDPSRELRALGLLKRRLLTGMKTTTARLVQRLLYLVSDTT